MVAEIVRATGATLAGFVDDGVAAGTEVLGARVLGGIEWLLAQPQAAVALGVGTNSTRARVAERLVAAGHLLPTWVHPSALISPTASLGDGTVVMPRVVVNAEARVGIGVILNTGCVVEHQCEIGDYVHLSPAVALGGDCRIGARTHVGINATLVQLIHVGADCVVGAGAVVIRHVGDGQTVAGVPAKPLPPRAG